MNALTAALFVQDRHAALTADGFAVAEHRGLDGFAEAYQRLADREAAPPLSVHWVDTDPADGLWTAVTAGDGAVVALQAFRRERLSQPLSAHLDRQYARMYCSQEIAITGHAPGADQISGNVVYHGNIYVAAKLRRTGIASIASQLGLALCCLQWQPDFVWGFIREELINSGYTPGLGYWHMQPIGTHYTAKPPGIGIDDWLVWMSANDLNYLMATHLRRRGSSAAGLEPEVVSAAADIFVGPGRPQRA